MINKIIGVVFVVAVVIGGAFFLFQDKTQKSAGSKELDQTFSVVDGVETSDAISAKESLDSASINQEANQIDFSEDLAGFASDDSALKDLDQTFGDILQ